MKKVILMAAVAMLFVGTAAAQGKVTTTASKGTPAATATTCKKDAKCPNATQCQGKKADVQTVKQGGTVNASAKNGAEVSKKGNTNTACKNTNLGGKKTINTQATTKVEK